MKILFITATRIGDAILSTGVLHELIRRHPEARITVACGPLAQSLFAHVPGLERVIVLTKRPLSLHWLKLWNEVRGTRWDIIVDLRRSLVPLFLRKTVRHTLGPTDATKHRVMFLPSVLGVETALSPHLWVGEGNRENALRVLPDGPPVVALAPVAARPEKTWPAESFAALVALLAAPGGPCNGWRVMVVGGPGEEDAAAPIMAKIPPQALINFIGERDLLTVAAVLSRCALFVGNDSGLSHLAAASGAPTLALFGPTNPLHYAPWGDHCCVVEAPAVNGARDMAGITVDAVATAVRKMIDMGRQ
ncbi:MAG: glycosyltransferase family 9 protein [Rhodospirillaceae bacterium]|nr:glycosyltransferase family 9 protein [Rhodospirillaceae bacterium]